jgi:hypothetical protein
VESGAARTRTARREDLAADAVATRAATGARAAMVKEDIFR